jgi:WD40 repeat protein
LGKIYSWNGGERNASLQDLDRKFSRLPANQLEKHLRHSIGSLKGNDLLGISPSLLQPLAGIYNCTDLNQRDTFRTLTLRLSDCYSKSRINKYDRDKLLRLKTYLESEESSAEVTESICDEEISTMQSTQFEDDGCVVLTSNMQPILKQIGQKKELSNVLLAIDESLLSEGKLMADMSRILSELSLLGCLSSGRDRGCVDSGMCFLNNRMIGLSKWSTGQISKTGLPMAPSAERMRRKILCNYRLLWTSSGHALNPAYCTIIDGSGRFAITGADDYLVKVWDIEKGVLALTCRGHNGFISIIALSPDNSLLASACTLGVIRIWRLHDGCCIKVLKHGDKQVNWIAFDRTNCALASVGDEGNCIVWDLSMLLSLQNGYVPLISILRPAHTESDHSSVCISPLDLPAPNQFANCAKYESPEKSSSSARVSGGEAIDLSQKSLSTEMYANLFAASLMSDDICNVSSNSSSSSSSNSSNSNDNDTRNMSGVESEGLSSSQQMIEKQEVTDTIDQSDNIWSTAPIVEKEMSTATSQGNGVSRVLGMSAGAHSVGKHPPGLFEWNSVQFPGHSNKLVLPHIRDTLVTAATSAGIKVQCLDVSPLGGILATGCEDGIVRVWRYGSVSTDVSFAASAVAASGHMNRSTVPPAGTRFGDDPCLTLQSSFSPREAERMQRVFQHMLPRLEGHVSGVTDLRFSNEGDRIVTGSLLDGTVRIWTFTKNFNKNDHIVLVMADDDEEGLSGGGNRGGRRTMNRQKNKPQVNSVCWTKNDASVITLQSVQVGGDVKSPRIIASTRLKVWDSVTGDLLRVIPCVSAVTANVLYPHPLDPTIVLTGGEDGMVIVWDTDKEEKLSSHFFSNPIPGNVEETKIHDASFSPDGSRISVTDSFGRVSILGLDNPARYKDVAQEQYYSTDYHDIMMYVRMGWDVQSMCAFNCRVDTPKFLVICFSCVRVQLQNVKQFRHHYI